MGDIFFLSRKKQNYNSFIFDILKLYYNASNCVFPYLSSFALFCEPFQTEGLSSFIYYSKFYPLFFQFFLPFSLNLILSSANSYYEMSVLLFLAAIS